jgi:hypothetical protein
MSKAAKKVSPQYDDETHLPGAYVRAAAVEPKLPELKALYATAMDDQARDAILRQATALVGSFRMLSDMDKVKAEVKVRPGVAPEGAFVAAWDALHDIGGKDRHLNALYGLAIADGPRMRRYLAGEFDAA